MQFFYFLNLIFLIKLANKNEAAVTTTMPRTTTRTITRSATRTTTRFTTRTTTRSTTRTTTTLLKPCGYGYTTNYCDQCGLQYSKPNLRIIGGKEATPHSWPSMALVLFQYKFYLNVSGKIFVKNYKTYCSGNLIDRTTVITAGHCLVETVSVRQFGYLYNVDVKPNSFYPTIESMYTIYLGMHSILGIYDGSDIRPGIAVNVSKFIRHPNYNSSTISNDISVIKLGVEVKFNNYIQPACLPNPAIPNYPTSSNVFVYVCGWGRTSLNGPLPNNLHNVRMTLFSKATCNKLLPPFTYDWNKQICVGDIQATKDTCDGDSGGPVFLKDKINGVERYILVGITSFGYGCGEYPGIYTKTWAYLSWINQVSLTTNIKQ